MERYIYRVLGLLVIGLLFYFVRIQIIENMNDRHLERISKIQAETQERLRQQLLEKERASAQSKERARFELERLQKQARADKAFDQAFHAWYQEPEGCNNWQSDRHMVECVQHKMTAKSKFRTTYKEN